jgi:hypothetical protein
MKMSSLAICAILMLQSVVAAGEISRAHAHHLAAAYFARYVSGCGGVEAPVPRGDYWEAPVRFGYAGTPSGAIRIHRHAGVVSYSWRFSWHSESWPTVAAADLDAWRESIKKRSRASLTIHLK